MVYWDNNQLDDLQTYINQLYTNNPTYMPTIIASSFVDAVYEGHISEAVEKLTDLQTTVEQSPENWSDAFLGAFDLVLVPLNDELRIWNEAAERRRAVGLLQASPPGRAPGHPPDSPGKSLWRLLDRELQRRQTLL